MKNSGELHILHIPSWYLPEGGQFCRNQVQALNENGVKTNILANVTLSIRKYGLKKIIKLLKITFMSHEDNINVYRHYHISIPFFKKLDGILWSYETLRIFQKYCKAFGKPDLSHVHSVLWGGYAAYLISKKTGIPYIITEHKGIFGMSCQYAADQFLPWQTPYMEKAFSNAEAIIPVSNKLIPKINTYLTQQVPYNVISNMVDTSLFHYKKRINNDKIINAVMVNGFTHSKAYDILFPAIEIAFKTVENLRLTIVGEDFCGLEFDELLKKVSQKDKIQFYGEADKYGVREALWNADFFIISSRVESQSVSTIEALCTGLPVVCTEVIPEQIANESNSIKVPVENIESLANAIVKMSNSYNKYNKEEISNITQDLVSRKSVVNKLIKVYQQVLSL